MVAAWGVVGLDVAVLTELPGPRGAGRTSREPDTTTASALDFLLQPVLENVGRRGGRASRPDYKSFTTSRPKWGGFQPNKGKQPACAFFHVFCSAHSLPTTHQVPSNCCQKMCYSSVVTADWICLRDQAALKEVENSRLLLQRAQKA